MAVDSGPRAKARAVAVINRAEIARQHVIWINDDPAFNAQTFGRYPGRRHWWLGWTDDGAPCLIPYEDQFGANNPLHDERPHAACGSVATSPY